MTNRELEKHRYDLVRFHSGKIGKDEKFRTVSQIPCKYKYWFSIFLRNAVIATVDIDDDFDQWVFVQGTTSYYADNVFNLIDHYHETGLLKPEKYFICQTLFHFKISSIKESGDKNKNYIIYPHENLDIPAAIEAAVKGLKFDDLFRVNKKK